SLPPTSLAGGELHLGKVFYDRPRWEAGLSRGELLQNLAIFGRSGSGKTNLAFHLLRQLDEKGIPFLFLDWKQTGRHLLPALKRRTAVYTPGRSLAPFCFNPLEVPPGMDRRSYWNLVIDILADAFTLGEGARSLLQKALAAAVATDGQSRSPTIPGLLRALEALPARQRQHGWKLTATRALQSLEFAQLAQTADSRPQDEMLGSLLT
ncbi:MAG: DUF87 domain-containing protein, partial [Chloroflexi bacterium]|nr:DUF87 domain-containing protein [Chloroflexota bacterium]